MLIQLLAITQLKITAGRGHEHAHYEVYVTGACTGPDSRSSFLVSHIYTKFISMQINGRYTSFETCTKTS